MSAGARFMASVAARMVQPFTSSEYMGGGSPIASTAHCGALSEETLSVAPSESRVLSLSLEVDRMEVAPIRAARWKNVSARMNSPDSI